MPLVEVIDPNPSGAGYKFDLLDEASGDIVKVFAARDAVVKAIATAGAEREFDAVLIDAATEKFDRGDREPDGAIVIEVGDLKS